MAAKKGSFKKSKGKPLSWARKRVRREKVKLLAAHKMTPGQLYVGWLCKAPRCGLLIAIKESGDPAGMLIMSADHLLEAVACPHCLTEESYRWSDREWRKYITKAPS
jgi:hypothetical protein